MGMTEGELVEWLVKDGDQVSEGDPVYSLESDKSTYEVPAPSTGVLNIIAKTGETYQVNHLIGIIE